MGRFQEITDEPVAAPTAPGSRYQEVDAAPATKSLDPDDEVPDDERSAQILGRKLQNTGSYEDVMDQWRRDNRALSGETGPTLSGLITGEQPKRPAAPAAGSFNKKQSAVMGFGQGASLGFADEALAGAGTVASKIPGMSTFMHYWTGLPQAVTEQAYDPNVGYPERREMARGAFKRAQEDNPVSYGAGEFAGTLATTPIMPGGGAVTFGSKAATMAARAGIAGMEAGAAQGLGVSEADLTQGEFGKAFKDAARSGIVGGITGGVLGGIGGKIISRAPAKEAETLMTGVAAGEGMAGRATVKAAKLMAAAEENAVPVLRANKDLYKAAGQPAKEALPVFKAHLDKVGSKLDPHYDVVDKATGGGASMTNLANYLDQEVAKLATEPGNEIAIKAIEDIKKSALKAWAPELAEKLAGNARANAMGLEGGVFKNLKDVVIPTRRVRAYVTKLQNRGTEIINALNPGESTKVKGEMATMMKGFLDANLDIAAESGPTVSKAVDAIRELNKEYSATATMANAIEQRGWKEATGNQTFNAIAHNLLKHGGVMTAIPKLLAGHPLQALATIASPYAIPGAEGAARAATMGIARTTRSDTVLAKTILALIEAGVPRATAIQVARAQSPGHLLGAETAALPTPPPEPENAATPE